MRRCDACWGCRHDELVDLSAVALFEHMDDGLRRERLADSCRACVEDILEILGVPHDVLL